MYIASRSMKVVPTGFGTSFWANAAAGASDSPASSNTEDMRMASPPGRA
jgi:hypothetical protein